MAGYKLVFDRKLMSNRDVIILTDPASTYEDRLRMFSRFIQNGNGPDLLPPDEGYEILLDMDLATTERIVTEWMAAVGVPEGNAS